MTPDRFYRALRRRCTEALANYRNPYRRQIRAILRERLDYSEYENPEITIQCDQLFEDRWACNRIAYCPQYWADHFEIRNVLQSKVLGSGPVLDIGCGTGNIDIELAKLGYRITGIDLSPKAIALADLYKSSLPSEVQERLIFTRVDIETYSPDVRFDACMIMHVLEHIEDPAFIFTSLRRIMADGGRIWVSVPFGDYHDDPSHVHRFCSPEEFATMLEQYALVESVNHDSVNHVLHAILRAETGDH